MHAGYIGTDRNLLTGHNALLLRQIALGIFYKHYYIEKIIHGTAFDKQLAGYVSNMPVVI